MPIPEQTVDQFILKVLPAARLTHFPDLFSNTISHFQISEPHSSLLIEAQSRVSTNPPTPLPSSAKLCSFAEIQDVSIIEAWFNFLQASRFVGISPEAWKLALDASQGLDDVWLAALALMKFVFGYLKYESYSTHVHTHMAEVMADRRGQIWRILKNLNRHRRMGEFQSAIMHTNELADRQHQRSGRGF